MVNVYKELVTYRESLKQNIILTFQKGVFITKYFFFMKLKPSNEALNQLNRINKVELLFKKLFDILCVLTFKSNIQSNIYLIFLLLL